MAHVALYASIGTDLIHYDVDVGAQTLTRRGSVRAPAMIQYVWPHVSRRFVYVASGVRNASHPNHLSAFRIDPGSGALAAHGSPVALPARPIHLTTDVPSKHVLTAYNAPSSLTVHRIEEDGSIGGEINRVMPPLAGIYAHQIRIMPSGDGAIIVARGNDKKNDKPEDPGALRVFTYTEGRLVPKASIAPNGGFGFGPRHIDFHPTQPWLYASLERQNALAMFAMHGDDIEPEPRFVKSTLADAAAVKTRQIACTIHVHPNGRFVYVPNRAYDSHVENGVEMADGGENNMAVFALDMASGEPTRVQNIDTHGFGVRTFSIDPSGRLLIAANLLPLNVRDGSGIRTVPASFALFAIGDDGKLEFLRKIDVETGGKQLYWTGMIELPENA